MSELLTEADVAAQFAGQPSDTANLTDEAAAWLDENETAPAPEQFDIGAAIEAGVQQHLSALAQQYEAARQEQQETEAYQTQLEEWLAEAAHDPDLYAQRVDAIRLEQLRAEVRDELSPLFELAAQVQAQQQAEQQNEALQNGVVGAVEVLSEEREQLGDFSYDAAYTAAEQLTEMQLGRLVAQGWSVGDAMEALHQANFAEVALRAGARITAGNASNPSTPGQPRGMFGVGDELSVARNFIDRSQQPGPPPRSPSEAIRAVEARGGFNPYGPNNPPTSELDVARRFMDARRDAFV